MKGDWLSDEERHALYEYLLASKLDKYSSDAEKLLNGDTLQTSIAEGEIAYSREKRKVTYAAKDKKTGKVTPEMRELRLGYFKGRNFRRLEQFFAQCEVDVIWNFPCDGFEPQSRSGYGINPFPYYSLLYYSNGKGRLRGLIKKLRTDNSELVKKLAS